MSDLDISITQQATIAALQKGEAAIPMRGSVESLNVSVASGVCLYEATRQRQASTAG